MAEPQKSVSSLNGDIKATNGDSQEAKCPYPVFRDRLREAAAAKALTYGAIAKKTGLTRGTMQRYWDGNRLPPADVLLKIADAVGVSMRWLLGSSEPERGLLTLANDADWVSVNELSLKDFDDTGPGDPVATMPIRRDWLYNALGETSGIWITKMIAPYPAAMLAEGAAVFCKSVQPGEQLVEKGLYLFRINGGIVTARFTFRDSAIMATGDRLGEEYVSAAEVGTDDDKFAVIARIIGVLARPI